MVIRCFLFFLATLYGFITPAQAAVESIALDEAHSVLVMRSDHLQVAMVQLRFLDAGAISDPQGKEGRAGFGAAILMEGAGEYDALAFKQALEDKAIDLSISAGQEDVTLTLRSLTQHLPTALEMVGTLLTKPRFADESIAKIRRQRLSQLKQRQENPGWVASRRFDELAYGDHPLARPEEGTKQSLNALNAADLRAWLQQLAASQMQISVAGKFEVDSLAPALREIRASLPETADLRPVTPIKALATPDHFERIEKAIPQSVVIFGLPMLQRDDPDFYAGYIMNHILGGGGLTGRLSNMIRQKHGLAYYASSYLSLGRYHSQLRGQFATRNEAAMQAVELAQQTLTRFAEDGATAEEVQNAVDYLTGSFPLALDDLSSQLHYLSLIQRYDLGVDYIEKRNSYFEAVTPQAVNRVAAKILAQAPIFVLVGNPKQD